MNAVNLDVHHNDISQTSDSGLLTFRNFTGLYIRDNVFGADSINLRVQSEGSPEIQEAYVYRNTFHQPKQPGGRHIFYGNADSTASPPAITSGTGITIRSSGDSPNPLERKTFIMRGITSSTMSFR